MALIQVIEHERLRISDQTLTGVKTISEVQAKALEKVQNTLPAKAIEWGHQSVKFSQYCGLITIGKDCIEVLPKIYNQEADYAVCRQVLIKMLYAAKWLKPQPHGTGSINLQKYHLLDVFILQFCEELFVQLRQGMIKRYISQTDNLPVLRGKLLIDSQLRHNLAHKERVYCQYDELVTNNTHNQIIKYVLKILLKVAYAGASRKKLTELLYSFDEVADKSFVKDDVKKLYLDRSNKRFALIFQQCEWFLAGLSPDVLYGDQQSMVLLFDMNRLFEDFVAQKLKKAAWQKGYKIRAQGPQKYLVIDESTDKSVFMMKPDLTLLDSEGDIKAILDTKWKLLDDTDKKKNISQADLYQMISYGVRYECSELHLLYPAHKKLNINETQPLSVVNSEYKIFIHAVDLEKLTKSKSLAYWDSIVGIHLYD